MCHELPIHSDKKNHLSFHLGNHPQDIPSIVQISNRNKINKACRGRNSKKSLVHMHIQSSKKNKVKSTEYAMVKNEQAQSTKES